MLQGCKQIMLPFAHRCESPLLEVPRLLRNRKVLGERGVGSPGPVTSHLDEQFERVLGDYRDEEKE